MNKFSDIHTVRRGVAVPWLRAHEYITYGPGGIVSTNVPELKKVLPESSGEALGFITPVVVSR